MNCLSLVSAQRDYMVKFKNTRKLEAEWFLRMECRKNDAILLS